MDARIFFLPYDYETKLKIIHAIDRPIEKMSVQEIANCCGISRQTFYRNFGSKDEMIMWYSLFARSQTIAKIGYTFSWLEAYTSYLMLMKNESDFFHNVIDRTDIHDIAIRYTDQVFIDIIKSNPAISLTPRLEFCAHAQAILDVRITVEWIGHGFDRDPSELAEHIVACVPKELLEALEKK